MEEKEHDDTISIDFKALFNLVGKEKWVIIGITVLFTIGGAWYGLAAREEFVSEGKIMPEISGAGGSSLGGLANLVGIGGFELGLKNNTDAIRPDLYPDVIKSTPFFLNLFEQKFVDKIGDSIRFDEFFNKKIEESKSIDKEDLRIFEGQPSGVVLVNRLTEDRIKDLKGRISGSIDKQSGVISILVKMPDPVIAAEITKFTMNYLTAYVADYRTEKIKQEVDFLGRKVAFAKGEFYRDQSRKASYEDIYAAPTIRLQSADVRRERLQSEYKLSSSMYNELLKKYEEAKIKLQQQTPVFKILEPPVVPTQKSEPKKVIIILGSLLAGMVFSFIIIFIKSGFNLFK
ncbi:GNVR domain-containing protein [Arcticibacterium luteifluviistationis]|uniref:Lipopolysaccharide biosynthesis protein n=1 Tax=Arcticibacterium luteifluviistationis TaxID=1784714 RepID=A0A2Z4GF39_9BACT|nr:GNVR domain-containing protein [Arcticibacterium luteifluviistationis]AWV99840.1 lipopolysaccharide biosynthesis protein [Arcticibacterium luteifluviistationis]